MWLLLLAFLPGSESVFCKQCFNYNGQICVNAQDCNGNYCLLEEIVQYTGIRTVKKTCISQPYFQYPDGTYQNRLNDCSVSDIVTYPDGSVYRNYGACETRVVQVVEYTMQLCNSSNYCNNACIGSQYTTTYSPSQRNTNGAQYIVKICNDQNYCNDACNSNLLPTPPPIYPPTTFPPIVPGHVRCFNCETADGTDCRENICSGAYCLYERKITGNQMRVKKSCLQVAEIQLDDGTDIQTTNVCEIRNTYQSQYFVKMCNDQDFCNGYCNPADPVTNPPQRQPLVTCTCDGPQCDNAQCQANYCFFQRESRNGQQISTRRGCSQLPYVLYPDNTYSTQTNQCESKRVNDIDYQVLVCNNVNFCNTDCSLAPTGKTVVCTQCEANDVSDCTGGTCTGTNCLYEKQISQTTGRSLIKKSCIISDIVTYPDGSVYRNYGACETRVVQGVEYTMQLCNSSNYCNNACIGSQYTTTYSPSQSSGVLTVVATLFVCLFAQFMI